MKKLIAATTMLVALAASVFAVAHPRTYVVDLADGGTTCDITYNSYGPNYQATPDFTKFIKADKPMKGDTVEVHMKFKSSIDLSVLKVGVVDPSAAAGYWTLLNPDYQIAGTDIKAGQTYEFTGKYPVTTDCKGAMKICLQYDNADDKDTYKPVNKGAKLTFTKVATTTDTSKEVVKRTTPKTWNVNLSKYAAFLEIKTNHPWVNGKQDMTVISNYEGVAEITKAFGRELPLKGDTVVVTYKATSNRDISLLQIQIIENTAAVNWWKVLSDAEAVEFAKDIKAGTPFNATATFKLNDDAQEGVSLQIFYNVGDADGPAIFKMAK